MNDDPGPLPAATLAYYGREKTAPDVVVRVVDTAGLSPGELERQYCGGLGYGWSWSGRSTRSSAGPAPWRREAHGSRL